MAIAPQRVGIGIRRHFTTAGVHPYEQVSWERRDARITNFRDGSVAFEQPVGNEPVRRSLRLDLLRGLAEGERFGLGEHVRQQYVVVPSQRSP